MIKRCKSKLPKLLTSIAFAIAFLAPAAPALAGASICARLEGEIQEIEAELQRLAQTKTDNPRIGSYILQRLSYKKELEARIATEKAAGNCD
jgi:capsule polysaccharide export protein KpsE/RkpR